MDSTLHADKVCHLTPFQHDPTVNPHHFVHQLHMCKGPDALLFIYISSAFFHDVLHPQNPFLQCYHQNDSCIKMGSYESHFNVLLIVRDKFHKPQPFLKMERRAAAESSRGPSAHQPNAFPRGHTSFALI